MKRSEFLKTLGFLAVLGGSSLRQLAQAAQDLDEEDVWMPALFIGHGSPMNAVADNSFTQMLAAKGQSLLRPKAILVISAHWLTRGSAVTSAAKPPTLHDFYGFPDALYDLEYPAPGTPGGAKLVQGMLAKVSATLDDKRGFDHGAWMPLLRMYPQADIPTFQLSIEIGRPPEYLAQIGKLLRDLRKKGILVIGSGNLVHNLGQVAAEEDAPPPEWAEEFDAKAAAFIERGDAVGLANFANWGPMSRMAHPSNDHFLPLIYVMGLRQAEEPIQFIHEGFQHGSIGMRCVQIG
jgi:4,5-DOPA dioxygenase extradiol